MDQSHEIHSNEESKQNGDWTYAIFSIELFVEFIFMFLIMYTMISTLDDLYFNAGNVYMTLMMVGAMAVIMLTFMRHMYPIKSWNIIAVSLALLLFATGWFGTRHHLRKAPASLCLRLNFVKLTHRGFTNPFRSAKA